MQRREEITTGCIYGNFASTLKEIIKENNQGITNEGERKDREFQQGWHRNTSKVKRRDAVKTFIKLEVEKDVKKKGKR